MHLQENYEIEEFYIWLSHDSIMHRFSILFKQQLVVCLNMVYFEISFNDWIIYSLFQISFQKKFLLYRNQLVNWQCESFYWFLFNNTFLWKKFVWIVFNPFY